MKFLGAEDAVDLILIIFVCICGKAEDLRLLSRGSLSGILRLRERRVRVLVAEEVVAQRPRGELRHLPLDGQY